MNGIKKGDNIVSFFNKNVVGINYDLNFLRDSTSFGNTVNASPTIP